MAKCFDQLVKRTTTKTTRQKAYRRILELLSELRTSKPAGASRLPVAFPLAKRQ
jgi:hypothetical protein